MPEPTSELDTGGICAPRTDAYSTYSDAFMNPDAACPDSATGNAMSGLFHGPRHYKVVFGYEQLRWGRTCGGNTVLTRTTPNLFDDNPLQVNGDPNGDPVVALFPSGNVLPPNGIIQVNNPNSQGVGIVVPPGGDPNAALLLFPNVGFPSIGEVLIANQERMQTDQFGFGREYGYRPKISIEFEDESRITFSYFWVEDFQARLLEDVSGAAFLSSVISDDDSPFLGNYQRFGYINAPFVTSSPFFGGERRRQIGDDPSIVPHDPVNESPPLNGFGQDVTSRDVPREPTVNDPAPLNGPEDVVFRPSLLWTDGEVAIADYDFDVQGADLFMEKNLTEWMRTNWKIFGVAGVKYVALDEGFTFTFADIAPPGEIGSTGYTARSPFDRFAANNPLLPVITNARAQPSLETVAIHNMSVDNDIIGPQIGLHTIRPFANGLEVDLMGKGSFAANFLKKDSYLVRGDGLVGFDRSRTEMLSSGIIEFQLGMNYCPHPNVRIRAGWEAMYLISIATATVNLDFNLDQSYRPNNNDDVLFHGWYFGGEVKF